MGKRCPSSPGPGDDLFGLLVPDEVLRIIVSVLCPDLDGFDKVRDRREHAAAETPLGQLQLVIIRS